MYFTKAESQLDKIPQPQLSGECRSFRPDNATLLPPGIYHTVRHRFEGCARQFDLRDVLFKTEVVIHPRVCQVYAHTLAFSPSIFLEVCQSLASNLPQSDGAHDSFLVRVVDVHPDQLILCIK